MGKKRKHKSKKNKKKYNSFGDDFDYKQGKGRKLMTKSKSAELLEPVKTNLRFNAYAWAKLKYLCQKGNTEIAGFGITGEDPFIVEDFLLVGQEASAAFVSMDDDAVADFLPDMVEKGFEPNQCMRIWIHTHPGASANPSGQDETTFRDVFGGCDYSLMFILARQGEVYCRLQVQKPKIQCLLPVYVDYTLPFKGSDISDWDTEYDENVRTRVYTGYQTKGGKGGYNPNYRYYDYGDDLYDDAWDKSMSTPKQTSGSRYRRPDLAGKKYPHGYYDVDGYYVSYEADKPKDIKPKGGKAKSGNVTYPRGGRSNFVTQDEKRKVTSGKGGTTKAVGKKSKRGKK